MLFKNNENSDKVTDFIEKNETNMANKENSSKNRNITLTAKDMVDETANTIILEKSAILNTKLEEETEENLTNINFNKQAIDKKVDEFYSEYKDENHEEYNSTGVKETVPSFAQDEPSPSDIYVKNNMYAGFWIRGLAFLIDYFLVCGIKNIIDYSNIFTLGYVLNNMMWIILFVLYNFISVYITNGYTIGKILTNIKVVPEKKEYMDFSTTFVREVAGKYILLKFPIIFFFLVFSSKKHSLIDYLSDTSVIREKYLPYFEKLTNDSKIQ